MDPEPWTIKSARPVRVGGTWPPRLGTKLEVRGGVPPLSTDVEGRRFYRFSEKTSATSAISEQRLPSWRIQSSGSSSGA